MLFNVVQDSIGWRDYVLSLMYSHSGFLDEDRKEKCVEVFDAYKACKKEETRRRKEANNKEIEF